MTRNSLEPNQIYKLYTDNPFLSKKLKLELEQFKKIMIQCGVNKDNIISTLYSLDGEIPIGLSTTQFTKITYGSGPDLERIINALKKLVNEEGVVTIPLGLNLDDLTDIMTNCHSHADGIITALQNLDEIPLNLSTKQFSKIMYCCGLNAQNIIDALKSLNGIIPLGLSPDKFASIMYMCQSHAHRIIKLLQTRAVTKAFEFNSSPLICSRAALTINGYFPTDRGKKIINLMNQHSITNHTFDGQWQNDFPESLYEGSNDEEFNSFVNLEERVLEDNPKPSKRIRSSEPNPPATNNSSSSNSLIIGPHTASFSSSSRQPFQSHSMTTR
jgi:predicted transcriptional regulator